MCSGACPRDFAAPMRMERFFFICSWPMYWSKDSGRRTLSLNWSLTSLELWRSGSVLVCRGAFGGIEGVLDIIFIVCYALSRNLALLHSTTKKQQSLSSQPPVLSLCAGRFGFDWCYPTILLYLRLFIFARTV